VPKDKTETCGSILTLYTGVDSMVVPCARPPGHRGHHRRNFPLCDADDGHVRDDDNEYHRSIACYAVSWKEKELSRHSRRSPKEER